MNTNASKYLVIRIRDIYRYAEYFGPMVSCAKDRVQDAQRLYGRPGHTIKVISWRQANAYQKKCALTPGEKCT